MTTYRIDTMLHTYFYRTGDVFKKKGKKYLHIVDGKQINSYSERTFNQVLYDKSIMELIDNMPITYKVVGLQTTKKVEETDSLIAFLDANPPEDTEERKPLTAYEKQLYWQTFRAKQREEQRALYAEKFH